MLHPWTVVMAQLVKRSLLKLEVCGSNTVIGKICIEHLFTVDNFEKTKMKKMELPIDTFEFGSFGSAGSRLTFDLCEAPFLTI